MEKTKKSQKAAAEAEDVLLGLYPAHCIKKKAHADRFVDQDNNCRSIEMVFRTLEQAKLAWCSITLPDAQGLWKKFPKLAKKKVFGDGLVAKLFGVQMTCCISDKKPVLRLQPTRDTRPARAALGAVKEVIALAIAQSSMSARCVSYNDATELDMYGIQPRATDCLVRMLEGLAENVPFRKGECTLGPAAGSWLPRMRLGAEPGSNQESLEIEESLELAYRYLASLTQRRKPPCIVDRLVTAIRINSSDRRWDKPCRASIEIAFCMALGKAWGVRHDMVLYCDRGSVVVENPDSLAHVARTMAWLDQSPLPCSKAAPFSVEGLGINKEELAQVLIMDEPWGDEAPIMQLVDELCGMEALVNVVSSSPRCFHGIHYDGHVVIEEADELIGFFHQLFDDQHAAIEGGELAQA